MRVEQRGRGERIADQNVAEKRGTRCGGGREARRGGDRGTLV